MTEPVPTTPAQAVESQTTTVGLPCSRTRARSLLWQLQQALLIGVLAFGCYFLISRFFVQSVTVVGMSMAPTLMQSERYLLNKWVFHVRAPQRSDVVVLRDPLDNGFSVKRIIGVGGDTVTLRRGTVYLNGAELSEPYLPSTTVTFGTTFKEQVFRCPAGYYFVLGDNRKNSVDSRNYGPVRRENILGLVVR